MKANRKIAIPFSLYKLPYMKRTRLQKRCTLLLRGAKLKKALRKRGVCGLKKLPLHRIVLTRGIHNYHLDEKALPPKWVKKIKRERPVHYLDKLLSIKKKPLIIRYWCSASPIYIQNIKNYRV